MERKMFYNAGPEIFEKAKQLRENMTLPEKLLWIRIKGNQLGYRFKPQHPLDIFIADFYCHKLKLVIELDGEIHNHQKDYDIARTDELKNHGITVIRFTNDEVINQMEVVILKIKNKMKELVA